MKVRVYRSLDKPNSFFTIKGRYMYLMVAGVGLSCLLAIAVGAAFGKVPGFLALGAGAVASYFITLAQQGKHSDREFFRMLSARNVGGYIRLRPVRMERLFGDIDGKKHKN